MSVKEFTRFREMMVRLSAPSLRQALALTTGTPGSAGSPGSPGQLPAGSVLRGLPAAILLLQDDPALHPALVEGLRQLDAIGKAAGPNQRAPVLRDAAGHTRKVYHPFVLHLHLAAFLRRYETIPASLWGACEEALAGAVLPARQIETYADNAPPLELTALVLWQALCLLDQARLESRDVDAELVDAVVHTLVHHPGPEGSLHPRSNEESLDAWTYRELTGLHALANLALARRQSAWSHRVEEIAAFHLANTQPDHTTTEPWAVFAFLWSPKTRSFAEQQLHDATAAGATPELGPPQPPVTPGNPGSVGSHETPGLSPISAMLLADAADALATFDE